MARSIDEIQAAIIADVQADSTLSGLTSTSKRAIWRLWTFVIAVSINILEQLIDVFKTNTDATVLLSSPQTPQWLQDKVFKFQYSATNPQVIQIIDLVPQYPVVDTTLRIVTRCSVKTNLAGSVTVKVAKGTTPAPLSGGELAALQSYVAIIGVTGVAYAVTSTDSDKIYINADVYYQGAYASIIQTNVIDAVNSFLASLPFDGTMKINDLEMAMRQAEGVNDVVLKNVVARANGTALVNGTYLVINNQFVGRLWPTISGYMVTETTSGSTINDTINYIAE
jgi:hypothetical protein